MRDIKDEKSNNNNHEKIKQLEEQIKAQEKNFNQFLELLPNMIGNSVAAGIDQSNREIKKKVIELEETIKTQQTEFEEKISNLKSTIKILTNSLLEIETSNKTNLSHALDVLDKLSNFTTIAISDQKLEIEKLQNENQELKNELKKLKVSIEELKTSKNNTQQTKEKEKNVDNTDLFKNRQNENTNIEKIMNRKIENLLKFN